MKQVNIYRIEDKRFVRYILLHINATTRNVDTAVQNVLGPLRLASEFYFWETIDIPIITPK